MASVDVRPPVIVVRGAEGDGSLLHSVPPPEGWERREGFRLPERPWDLSSRRWMCTGLVTTEGDAEMALKALVRGVGLIIGVGGSGGFRLRILDDIHHVGAVVEVEPQSGTRLTLSDENVALLRALADGATVEEAARRAGMSQRTAHRRLATVRAELRAVNTTEAVARWLEQERAASQ